MELEKLYTVDDVAGFTNLSSRTIRTYLKEGILKGKKIGGQWRFTMENISELLNNNNAVTDMINANDQNLIDFINGTNTDVSGEIQICAVADYYCSGMEYASALSQNFSDIFMQSFNRDGCSKYNFYFDAVGQKARYIFFGTPYFIAKSMEILSGVWEYMNTSTKQFSGKAKNYLKGRPDYPEEFFNYLYGEFGMQKEDVIADIGSGVGKISKHFLERGNKVFCVEPNTDMSMTADELLSHYKHYTPVTKPAEDTGIDTSAVDYIICGNSYDYFDRNLSKPEFARILKERGKVIITYYGPHNLLYSNELGKLNEKYARKEDNPILRKKRDYSSAFKNDKYVEKVFDYNFNEDWDGFLEGSLSYSGAPSVGDDNFEPYCEGLKQIFDNYKKDEKLESIFRLRCLIGNVNDLL